MPEIIDTHYDVDSGVMLYTVSYNGTVSDMTKEQYDYAVASAEAVERLDQGASSASSGDSVADTDTSDQVTTIITVTEESSDDDLPFVGSLTAYDDAAADTPALYANLESVDNTFTSIMDWFGDTFFIERTETVHKSGYTSERYSYSGSTQTIQLPYEEDATTTKQVLNPQAVVSAVLVVLVFITVVTWLRSAIWGRIS